MKKLLCPQCKIAGMYVKNNQGERLLVYIAQDGTDKILSDTPPSCANKPKLHHRLTDYTEKHYYHLSLAI